MKYLKVSQGLSSYQHFSFKYFLIKCTGHEDMTGFVRLCLGSTDNTGLTGAGDANLSTKDWLLLLRLHSSNAQGRKDF